MKELPNPTFALSPVALPRLSRGSLQLHQGSHIVHTPSVQIRPVLEEASSGKITVSWARHQDEVR